MAILNGHNAATQISLAEAKKKLTGLVKAVEDTERVTICRRGTGPGICYAA